MKNERPGDKNGDAPDVRRKEEKSSSLTVERRKCTYTKGGKCREHGAGAKERWKPTSTNVIGPDGKLTVKKGIKYFFVCDINKDKKKQTQTSRSVKKTTASSKT